MSTLWNRKPIYAKFCYECGINLLNANNSDIEGDNSNGQMENTADDNFREESETKEKDLDSNRFNNNCIVCKSGEMVPTFIKDLLVLESKKNPGMQQLRCCI